MFELEFHTPHRSHSQSKTVNLVQMQKQLREARIQPDLNQSRSKSPFHGLGSGACIRKDILPTR
jgi:hypothetical protein